MQDIEKHPSADNQCCASDLKYTYCLTYSNLR